MKYEHVIQCCGAKVAIKGNNVKVLTEPRIRNCPLHQSLYGFKIMGKEAVKKTVEFKMQKHGFCCRHRAFTDATVVLYGASEIIKTCLEAELFDCAVLVCEGAGTVITSNPSLVQGIGAHLTGIMKTMPIEEIVQHVKDSNGVILDVASARIDQAKGFQKAAEMGFRKIAVTIAGFQAEHITRTRRLEGPLGVQACIFSVCNTCTTEEVLKNVVKADIVTASASQLIRQQIGPRALMQLGVTIPVFALTERGKQTLLSYLSKFDEKIVAFRGHLPYIVDKRGPTLKHDSRRFRNKKLKP